jgi:hypothetical protein
MLCVLYFEGKFVLYSASLCGNLPECILAYQHYCILEGRISSEAVSVFIHTWGFWDQTQVSCFRRVRKLAKRDN